MITESYCRQLQINIAIREKKKHILVYEIPSEENKYSNNILVPKDRRQRKTELN